MIIKSLFLQPLGPALVLALGMLLLTLGRRFAVSQALRAGGSRSRLPALGRTELWGWRLRLPFAVLTIVAAGVLLVLLRGAADRQIVQWAWQPLTVAGSALNWRIDSWNWLTSLLLLILAAVALLLEDGSAAPLDSSARTRRGAEVERTLGLAAAALLFVSSGNVLTLASTWLVLDAALTLRLLPTTAPERAGRAWGLLSLSGVLFLFLLALLGESGIRAGLTGQGDLDGLELALAWLAALIRAGVYPLHFWLTGPGRLRLQDRIAVCLVGPLTGLWLLGRLHAIALADWLRRPEWVALGVLALLGTALVAWATDDEGWRWRWIALNRASMVVLAAYVAPASGPEALAWPLITFGLGTALLAVGQAMRARLGWRGPVGFAVLVIWGLPGTAGFLARTVLVYPTELPFAVPLFGVLLIAEVLLVAALWQAMREGQGETAGGPLSWAAFARLAAALVVLAAPVIVWGLAPGSLARTAGWPAGELFAPLGGLLIHARRSVWAGLLLSAMLGAGLGVARASIFAQMRGWQSAIVAIASLDWLYQMASLAMGLLASGLQYFAALGEGEGYLGWLALAAVILWVLLRG